MNCGVDHRHGSDPGLLWLWRTLVAVVLIGPLAWEPPHAVATALKTDKDKMKHTHTHKQNKTKKKQLQNKIKQHLTKSRVDKCVKMQMSWNSVTLLLRMQM